MVTKSCQKTIQISLYTNVKVLCTENIVIRHMSGNYKQQQKYASLRIAILSAPCHNNVDTSIVFIIISTCSETQKLTEDNMYNMREDAKKLQQ